MDFTRERQQLKLWVEEERKYADDKYASEREVGLTKMVEEEFQEGGYWETYILGYLRRAQLFGLSTPQGRQALAKAHMTIMACVEFSIMVFGDMPKPGVPSGEIQVWNPGAGVDFDREPLL